jgi:hypothetical protein
MLLDFFCLTKDVISSTGVISSVMPPIIIKRLFALYIECAHMISSLYSYTFQKMYPNYFLFSLMNCQEERGMILWLYILREKGVKGRISKSFFMSGIIAWLWIIFLFML